MTQHRDASSDILAEMADKQPARLCQDCIFDAKLFMERM